MKQNRLALSDYTKRIILLASAIDAYGQDIEALIKLKQFELDPTMDWYLEQFSASDHEVNSVGTKVMADSDWILAQPNAFLTASSHKGEITAEIKLQITTRVKILGAPCYFRQDYIYQLAPDEIQLLISIGKIEVRTEATTTAAALCGI